MKNMNSAFLIFYWDTNFMLGDYEAESRCSFIPSTGDLLDSIFVLFGAPNIPRYIKDF